MAARHSSRSISFKTEKHHSQQARWIREAKIRTLANETKRLETIIQCLERTTPRPEAAVTTPEESRKLADILFAWITKTPNAPEAAILAEDVRNIVNGIKARYRAQQEALLN